MSALPPELARVYGPQYDPATHSWPVGVQPTGPVCGRCRGRGSREVNVERDPATNAVLYDEEPCGGCNGTGVRPPAGVLS